MPDHARSAGTRVVGAAAALLALLPATAAAAELPEPAAAPALDAPALSLPAAPVPLPDAPQLALPPLATISAACRGAHRRRRAAVRCLVNRARHRAGLRGFRRQRSLAKAATRQARDMARRRYFGHQRAGGPPLERRARRAGWRGSSLGEAIAYGCGRSARPLAIVSSWLHSPPHAAILLSPDLRRVGIGSARPPVRCRGASYVLVAGRG